MPFFHKRMPELDPPLGEPRRAMAFRGGCALFPPPQSRQAGARRAGRRGAAHNLRFDRGPGLAVRRRPLSQGTGRPISADDKKSGTSGRTARMVFSTPLAVAAHRAAAGAPPVERARARFRRGLWGAPRLLARSALSRRSRPGEPGRWRSRSPDAARDRNLRRPSPPGATRLDLCSAQAWRNERWIEANGTKPMMTRSPIDAEIKPDDPLRLAVAAEIAFPAAASPQRASGRRPCKAGCRCGGLLVRIIRHYPQSRI